MKTWLTIRVFTSCATAPMMLPMSPMMLPMMKNLVDLSQLAELHVVPQRTLPSPAKDVGQLAYHEEHNSAKHDIC
jgi:hypothetical protein